MKIQKSEGQLEEFSEEKLRQSLLRAHASEEAIERVLHKVRQQLRRGLPTRDIYRTAFSTLRKEARAFAARYSLKHALLQLGPSGYPFEHYIAALFTSQGYQTRTGIKLPGRCVTHEVDVEATRPGHRILAECKYRNASGRPTDVKIALYVHARAQDLKQHPSSHFDEFWLITNDRFTQDAIDYGTCAGLKLLGWGFPERDNLAQTIEKQALFPISCLTSLKRKDKHALMESGVVLVKTLTENPACLERLHLRNSEKFEVLEEAKQLLQAVTVSRSLSVKNVVG